MTRCIHPYSRCNARHAYLQVANICCLGAFTDDPICATTRWPDARCNMLVSPSFPMLGAVKGSRLMMVAPSSSDFERRWGFGGKRQSKRSSEVILAIALFAATVAPNCLHEDRAAVQHFKVTKQSSSPQQGTRTVPRHAQKPYSCL